jgi:hypothetical protein
MRYPILVFLLAFARVALATTPDGFKEKYCKSEAGRKDAFAHCVNQTLELRRKIETVPPDTAQYLASEYAAVFSTKSEQRYRIVTSNPLFNAWRLREALAKFEAHEKTKVSSEGSRRANEVERYVKGLELLYDVDEAWGGYARFDSQRQPRVLSNDDFYDWGYKFAAFKHFVRRLAVCAAD